MHRIPFREYHSRHLVRVDELVPLNPNNRDCLGDLRQELLVGTVQAWEDRIGLEWGWNGVETGLKWG